MFLTTGRAFLNPFQLLIFANQLLIFPNTSVAKLAALVTMRENIAPGCPGEGHHSSGHVTRMAGAHSYTPIHLAQAHSPRPSQVSMALTVVMVVMQVVRVMVVMVMLHVMVMVVVMVMIEPVMV